MVKMGRRYRGDATLPSLTMARIVSGTKRIAMMSSDAESPRRKRKMPCHPVY